MLNQFLYQFPKYLQFFQRQFEGPAYHRRLMKRQIQCYLFSRKMPPQWSQGKYINVNESWSFFFALIFNGRLIFDRRKFDARKHPAGLAPSPFDIGVSAYLYANVRAIARYQCEMNICRQCQWSRCIIKDFPFSYIWIHVPCIMFAISQNFKNLIFIRVNSYQSLENLLNKR